MMFLAGVAQLNLMSALLRFVPRAGAHAGRLIIGAFLVGAALGSLAAALFRAGLGLWAPDLGAILGPWPVALSFVLAGGGWTVFVLQGSALVAVGRAAATVATQGFNIGKQVLLVGLVALLPTTGIWFAWVAAMTATGLGMMWFLLRRALPEFTTVPDQLPAEIPSASSLVRFVAPDYLASLAWIACTSLVPILVLDLTDSAHAAVFTLAWSMAFVLFGVPLAFGQSLVAHGVREPSRLRERYRRVVLYSLGLVTPPVLVVLVWAPLLLRLFGPWYASQGASTVRLLTLNAVPHTLVALAVSKARVTREMATLVWIEAGLAAIVLSLTWAPGGRRQLGARVADRLAGTACFTGSEAVLLAGAPGGAELPPRTVLLLTWLRHVEANPAKSERYAASPVWVRRNVMPVLRQVARD